MLTGATSEHADAASLRQAHGGSPKKIVVQLFFRGLLEGENLATDWIRASKYRLDGTVLTRRIERLEDAEQ